MAFGDSGQQHRVGDINEIVTGINKISLKGFHRHHKSDQESNNELIINQSNLMQHGGHSALNEEFKNLKNQRVNFSSKKIDFAKGGREHPFSGFNTSLPLIFNNVDRDESNE